MAFFRERIGGKTPWNAANKCPDFAAIRNAVFSKISSAGAKPYRFVLVDEAQDLDADAFRLLAAIADHVTVCADHKQQLYDNGSNVEVILQSLAVRRCNITLLETFRCCPYVVQLAATLIDDPVERNAYIRQSRTHQAEREMPLLYRAVNFDDEKARLIDVVRTRLTRGERIAVLFPQQRQAYGYATGFQQAGIDVENPKELDFSTDRPKLMPYHSAKGLTFDSVFLPRLIDKSFDKVSPIRRLRMLFVGITRATKWVYLSTTTGDKSFAPLDQLASEAVGHNLTVQLPTADLKAQSPGPERESTDDIADLL
jgi:superfamily I DNA/RNA helicase